MGKARPGKAPDPKPAAVLYVVRKRTVGEAALDASETGKVEAVFADRAAAERRCRELDAAVKRQPCPPGLMMWWPDAPEELAAYTTLPIPVLRDWLMDAGLEPPKKLKTIRDLTAWWEKLGGSAATRPTADQRAKFWEALNRFRFYEVRELGWVK